MKKVMLAFIALVSVTTVATAQKGSILVYGNVGFATSTDSFAFNSSSYTINPGIGIQLNDKWTAGLNIAFGGTRDNKNTGINSTTPSDNYNTTSFFNIGPFLRYTYAINNIFSIYGQTDVSYLSGKNNPYAIVSGSYNGFGIDLFPAFGINITKGYALNLSFGGLSYQTKTYKGAAYNSSTSIAPTSSASQFVFSLGQGVTFGISKNFGGSKKK